MREYRLALVTAGATFCLLVLGGLVHATGSSLACPDWPLCFGQFFPTMVGGILYEHGHRLVALAVAVLTAALAVQVFRMPTGRPHRGLAVLAVALVLVQALLGGLTVILRLPMLVSSSHLATSMAFFATILVLAHRLRPAGAAPARPGPRGWVGAATAATYLQLILGALVRHTGSALACGTAIPLCDGRLWPAGGPAQLQALHRIVGVVLALLVVRAAWAPLRDAVRDGNRARTLLAFAAPVLVAVQIALGFFTVVTFVSIPMATAHLAVGALLLADLLALYLSLGGRRAGLGSSGHPAPGLAPAHG